MPCNLTTIRIFNGQKGNQSINQFLSTNILFNIISVVVDSVDVVVVPDDVVVYVQLVVGQLYTVPCRRPAHVGQHNTNQSINQSIIQLIIKKYTSKRYYFSSVMWIRIGCIRIRIRNPDPHNLVNPEPDPDPGQ